MTQSYWFSIFIRLICPVACPLSLVSYSDFCPLSFLSCSQKRGAKLSHTLQCVLYEVEYCLAHNWILAQVEPAKRSHSMFIYWMNKWLRDISKYLVNKSMLSVSPGCQSIWTSFPEPTPYTLKRNWEKSLNKSLGWHHVYHIEVEVVRGESLHHIAFSERVGMGLPERVELNKHVTR